MCTWRMEGSFAQTMFSFNLSIGTVGPAWAVKLALSVSKCLYPLSCLASLDLPIVDIL